MNRSCVFIESLETRTLLSSAYHLTFDDEFNTFDSSRYQTSDFWGMRNNPGDYQGQWFSDTANNGYNPFTTTNGVLSITAQPTPAGVGGGQPYVSGQLTTAHKFTQRYGYYELRAKTPPGKGLWSRFWLLTDDGNWPGEYDAFEILGKESSKVHQTTHYKDANGNHAAEGFTYTGIDPTDGFHTYGLLWEPTGVTWYVDGVATETQVNRIDQPMYVLLDLAVGNDPNNLWPGTPDATTPWPSSLQMDYFRVYSADPSLPNTTPDAGYIPSAIPGGNTVEVTSTTAPLPSGWASTPLGTPDLKGNANWNPVTGEWMLKGAGFGIGGFGDQGHFAGKALSGDGTITATVSSVTAINSNDVKAGVMMRESTAANARAIGLFHITSANNAPATYSIVLQSRSATGGNTTTLATIAGVPSTATLRLSRSGNVFTASYSTDGGATWTTVATPQTIAMASVAQAGLALCGNQNNYFRLSRATFNNVSLVGATSTPPTVATPASASPPVVTGNTTNLSVLGADNTGEAGLVYTWSSTGPAAVTYSSNGTNAAKNVTATFTKAGSYTFTATIRDIDGVTTTSSVTVTVSQTLTSLSVSPSPVTVTAGTTQQFTASGLDQFGQTMTPSVTWSSTGGGSISTSGLYTAPAAGSAVTVTATAGAVTASSTVTVTQSVALPSPWTSNDINAAPAGSSSFSNGNWTITGGGTGVALNSSVPDNVDSFRFASAPMGGNGTIIVRVDASSGTQAGIVIRDGTGAGDRYAGLWRTADSLRWGTREAVSGGAWLQALRSNFTTLPVWLRIVRAADTFTASFSTDGNTWTTIGSRTFAMNASARAGLIAASGNNTTTATAVYSNVSVSNGGPTVVTPASGTPSTVTGKTATLAALGTDDGGEANLRYTWSLTGTPPAPVTFSTNGTNASKSTVATFSKAGTYSFLVTIADASGLSTTSSCTVTVNATFTGLSVSPPSGAALVAGATRQFTASAVDQFNNPMTTPAVVWSTTGSGNTISSTGLFTAGTSAGSYTVSATSGAVSASATVSIASASAFTANTDIGSVGKAGSSDPVSNGVYTVRGSGSDIWGSADAFQFEYATLAGDGQITARVVSLTNTNSWAKVGVMVRGSLAANSVHASTFVTPSNGVSFMRRTTTGGTSARTSATGLTAPYWLRIVRSGNTFSSYRSPDGLTWTRIGSTVTIAMGSTAYFGLAVSSHANTTLCTATFDHVSVAAVTNLARGRITTATSTAATSSAGNAVDGSTASLWTSGAGGTQSLTTDLGSVRWLTRITLNWGGSSSYAKSFQIQSSADGSSWTTLSSTTTGTGSALDLTGMATSARFVRVMMTVSNSINYSIAELSVFGI